jgi:DNA-binding XRE family transcriptional regulator
MVRREKERHMSRIRYRNPQLAAALARSGMNQVDLAAAVGVHRGTITALFCQRRSPLPVTARAIAQVLGTTPEELFGNNGEGAA